MFAYYNAMEISRRNFLAAPLVLPFAQPPQLPLPGPAGDPTPGRWRKLGLGDADRDGLMYVPRSFKREEAMPLLVLLHGAGNTALSTQYSYQYADEFNFIVVAPDSRDERTWDMIVGMWGPDLEFIGEAIKYAKRQCTIKDDHIGLAGFSDGASYALSMGIGNGDVFTRVMAMSPGLMQPAAVRGKPKIFISHGTADQVMPSDITSRKFVPRLKTLGYDVTYREYEGRHTLPPAIAQEAMEWFAK
jgi:phospholipase/carboxylesterase